MDKVRRTITPLSQTPSIITVLVFMVNSKVSFLTFVGPCSITIYFYSKTNKMHNISNLFYLGTNLYTFRTVFPPVIRSPRLYIGHHVLWVLASGNESSISFPLASSHRTCMTILMPYVVLRLLKMDRKTIQNV
jgi:hypothetical protein